MVGYYNYSTIIYKLMDVFIVQFVENVIFYEFMSKKYPEFEHTLHSMPLNTLVKIVYKYEWRNKAERFIGSLNRVGDCFCYYEFGHPYFIDKDFNFVLNGDGTQTKDLWTYSGDGLLKKDGCHYYTYDNSHKK